MADANVDLEIWGSRVSEGAEGLDGPVEWLVCSVGKDWFLGYRYTVMAMRGGRLAVKVGGGCENPFDPLADPKGVKYELRSVPGGGVSDGVLVGRDEFVAMVVKLAEMEAG